MGSVGRAPRAGRANAPSPWQIGPVDRGRPAFRTMLAPIPYTTFHGSNSPATLATQLRRTACNRVPIEMSMNDASSKLFIPFATIYRSVGAWSMMAVTMRPKPRWRPICTITRTTENTIPIKVATKTQAILKEIPAVAAPFPTWVIGMTLRRCRPSRPQE